MMPKSGPLSLMARNAASCPAQKHPALKTDSNWALRLPHMVLGLRLVPKSRGNSATY